MMLDWRVIRTDRDGRPRERWARLPRIRWPSMAVWDYCGGPGSSRGRYVLGHVEPAGSRGNPDPLFRDLGFRFKNLKSLREHLEEHYS